MVLLRVSLIRNPRKYCHCSGASQTSQKIRWMTFLPVELSYSLDSVIKDPLHCPPHPTPLPAPWMVPVPNSHRLSLLRCSPLQWKNRFRPYQSEEQIEVTPVIRTETPAAPKAKVSLQKTSHDQRSCWYPKLQVTKTRKPKEKQKPNNEKHPSNKENSEIET